MADIARSNSDFPFSYNDIDGLPVNAINEDSLKFQSSIPPNFLELYTNIVSFINEYQKAFLKENFNRMSRVVITMNDSITDYFKNDVSFKKDYLSELGKSITSKIKKQFKERKNESVDALKESVLEEIQEYKKKIIAAIKSKVISYSSDNGSSKSKTAESNRSSSIANATNTANEAATIRETSIKDSKAISGIATIDFINNVLKEREKEYNNQAKDFGQRIAQSMMRQYNEIISKATKDNIDQVKKSIEQINARFSEYFYSLGKQTNATTESLQRNNKSVFSKTLNVIRKTIVGTLNSITLAVSKFVFWTRSILKFSFFWIKAALTPVAKIIQFGINLTLKTLKVAWTGIKFIANSVWTVAKPLVNVTKRVLSSIWSLTKKTYDLVNKGGVFTIFGNMLTVFFKSYAGAYFLGYIFGRIWGTTLRILGISQKDIEDGNYSIKDDVLMPFLTNVWERITKYIPKVNTLKDTAGSIKDFGKKVIEKIKETKVYKLIDTVYESVKKIATLDNLKTTVSKIYDFFKDYVWPIIKYAAILMYGLFKGISKDPETFFRGRYGAIQGLKYISFFARHARLRGGLAGLLASGLVIGTSIMLGAGSNVVDNEVSKKEKNPITMGINKKYASVFGYYGTAEEDGDEANKNSIIDKFKDIHTLVGNRYKVYGKLNKFAKESKDSNVKENYQKIVDIFDDMTSRRNEAFSQLHAIEDLITHFEDESESEQAKDNKNWIAADYDLTHQILTWNGKYVYTPNDVDKNLGGGVFQKLKFLQLVLGEKLTLLDTGIRNFAKIVEDNNPEEAMEKIGKFDFGLKSYLTIDPSSMLHYTEEKASDGTIRAGDFTNATLSFTRSTSIEDYNAQRQKASQSEQQELLRRSMNLISGDMSVTYTAKQISSKSNRAGTVYENVERTVTEADKIKLQEIVDKGPAQGIQYQNAVAALDALNKARNQELERITEIKAVEMKDEGTAFNVFKNSIVEISKQFQENYLNKISKSRLGESLSNKQQSYFRDQLNKHRENLLSNLNSINDFTSQKVINVEDQLVTEIEEMNNDGNIPGHALMHLGFTVFEKSLRNVYQELQNVSVYKTLYQVIGMHLKDFNINGEEDSSLYRELSRNIELDIQDKKLLREAIQRLIDQYKAKQKNEA